MATDSNSSSTHIVAVCGSLRNGSLTRRALSWAVKPLLHRDDVTLDIIDPRHLDLRFPGQDGADELEKDIIARVSRADGVLLATPEYHGSFSSVLKALLDAMGYPSALAGKPVALIGVAAGRPGAVKSLDHLRSVCAHMGAIVLPYPVSVPIAHEVLSEEDHCHDTEIGCMLGEVGLQLAHYATQHKGYDAAPLDDFRSEQPSEP